MILETKRLYLRELNQGDLPSLCRILQDDEAMYAYEGAFTDSEVQEWLDRQIARYQAWSFGLWAVILKDRSVRAHHAAVEGWRSAGGRVSL